ncbi:hypothetical protein V6N13_056151 [Hibiscus sabdariffa]
MLNIWWCFSRACVRGCLNKSLVNNKIVLCDVMDGLDEAHAAGALGSITQTSLRNISFVVPLPSSALGTDDYSSLKAFLNSTNFFSLNVMQPDLSAPGVDILVAFSPVAPPS